MPGQHGPGVGMGMGNQINWFSHVRVTLMLQNAGSKCGCNDLPMLHVVLTTGFADP
jgi:hypothetical protein